LLPSSFSKIATIMSGSGMAVRMRNRDDSIMRARAECRRITWPAVPAPTYRRPSRAPNRSPVQLSFPGLFARAEAPGQPTPPVIVPVFGCEQEPVRTGAAVPRRRLCVAYRLAGS
jgi:hypothetical protein